MDESRFGRFSRREFLAGGSSLGAATLLGFPERAVAEPPPETTRLRLFATPVVSCIAPHYVAEELLHSEGFTDVRYVTFPNETQLWPPESLLTGEVDISLSFPPTDIKFIDAGGPIVNPSAASSVTSPS